MDNEILTQDRKFYTYFHTRNDTGDVFYIGKGCGIRYLKSGKHNPHWKNISAKHGHTAHLAMTNLTEDEAFEHEKFLIMCFKEMGVPLVNCTNGGEGPSGHIHTPETRARISAKMSALLIGNKRNLGRKVSEKSMAMMIGNKYALGNKHTAEWLEMRATWSQSPEARKKMSKIMTGNQHALGHKDTPEQRKRRSIAQIKRNTSINSTAKLTEHDIIEIRKSKVPPKKMAIEYGVSDTLIYRIIQRKAWSHVP